METLSRLLRQLSGGGDFATAIRGAGVVLSIRVAASVLAYLLILLLARAAGPDVFAAYTYAFTWAFFLGVPASLGVSIAGVRFLAEHAETEVWGKVRGYLSASVLLIVVSSTVFGLGALAVLGLLGDRVNEAYRMPLVVAFTWLPVVALVGHGAQVGRAFGWVGVAYAPTQILHPLLVLGAVGGLVALEAEITAERILLMSFCFLALAVALQAIVYARRLAPDLRAVDSQYEPRLWMRAALPLMFVDAMGSIISFTDVTMLGVFTEPAAVAYYFAAARTAVLVSFLHAAVSAFIGPRIAALYSTGRRGELQALLRGILPWVAGPTFLIAATIVALGPWLLRLFGSDFDLAYLPMAALACAQLLVVAAGPAKIALAMTGNQDLSARTIALAALANVVLNVALIPPFGIAGAAAATALAITGEAWGAAYLVRRETGLHTSIIGLFTTGNDENADVAP